jgi:hypothetical protein
MSFERSFPDEILLEIYRYLQPMEILYSLAGLNARFDRTIHDYTRHIHFSSIIPYEHYLYLLRHVLPSIWSSIESLTISNCQIPCLTTLFLDHTERLLPPRLKSLRLLHLNTNEIYNFLSRLLNECAVEELIVECADGDFLEQGEVYGFKIAQILFYRHPTLHSIELRGEIIFHIDHLSFLSLSTSDDSNVSHLSLISRTSHVFE